LNEALKDVQDKIIVNHEFIKGVRVLTAEEIKEREEDEQRRLDEESASKALEDAKTAEDVTTVPEDEETTEAAVDTEVESPEETTADTEAEATDTEPEETTSAAEGEEPGETAKDEVNPEDIVNNGKIVRVTYEGGKVFVLNYNNYAVTVDGYDGVISALGFVSYIAQEEVAEE
ncbi:MAG: hypothetical protein J5585_06480, partial [Clostridia bacterium]|nr:hypothetical protein [Clostridia bacterium]